jgi:putative endonuclease
MAYNKKYLGIYGEKTAAKFLQDNGYIIVETNWRFRHLEVDLIVQKADYLIFVEVKTRSSQKFGHPELKVDRKKQLNLQNAASAYLESTNFSGKIRFDIICVETFNQPPTIKWIEDVYIW